MIWYSHFPIYLVIFLRISTEITSEIFLRVPSCCNFYWTFFNKSIEILFRFSFRNFFGNICFLHFLRISSDYLRIFSVTVFIRIHKNYKNSIFKFLWLQFLGKFIQKQIPVKHPSEVLISNFWISNGIAWEISDRAIPLAIISEIPSLYVWGGPKEISLKILLILLKFLRQINWNLFSIFF